MPNINSVPTQPGHGEAVRVGDVVFDHLSVAIAHAQSAQYFVIQADTEATARWIDEAIIDMQAARAALESKQRELRRPAQVTEELAERDV